MESISRAVNDVVTNRQSLPGNADTWAGAANPSTAPSTTKRVFDSAMDNWKDLPLNVASGTYYSYSFAALDPTKDGKNVTLAIRAEGDLDGDGVPSIKEMYFSGLGYSFQPDLAAVGWDGSTVGPECPPNGAEDRTTF